MWLAVLLISPPAMICQVRGAMPVHPYSLDWYVGGSVLVPGRGSPIVEVNRFQLERFTISIKELAGWFAATGCPARCGRVPGSAREVNGKVPATLLSQVIGLLENRGPRTIGDLKNFDGQVVAEITLFG